MGPGRMMSAPTPWTLESRGDSSMIQGLSGTGLLRQEAKRGAVALLQHLCANERRGASGHRR